MTRQQSLPLLGLSLVMLLGHSATLCQRATAQGLQRQDLQRQDLPAQRGDGARHSSEDASQQPRRRGTAPSQQDDPRQRGRATAEHQSDQPSVQVVPPGQRWGGGRWVLGITSQTTSSGVRVRTVMPASAAAQAGLEPGDRIVTVDGFQVGRVGSRLYPLGDELQLRAGPQGDVLLLVQNRRNDQLINLPVQLGRRRASNSWPPRWRGGDRFPTPFQQNEPGGPQHSSQSEVE